MGMYIRKTRIKSKQVKEAILITKKKIKSEKYTLRPRESDIIIVNP